MISPRDSFLALLAEPRPLIMGVLNVTPDSFSDGGEYYSHQNAVRHALEMLDEGADIIDIGGESTRPPGKDYGAGSERITEAEELRRVTNVIAAIAQERPSAIISIDTTKSAVAQAAIAAGASIINDVSAGTLDIEMFALAAKQDVPIILMHGYGARFGKQRIEEYQYENVVESVREYLSQRTDAARNAGVITILADVGIGFAKTYRDNLSLLKNHAQFTSLGVPLVLGVSRKSTIGKAMGTNPPPRQRATGSLAAALYGISHGTKIIRTHDVKMTREAFAVISAIEG